MFGSRPVQPEEGPCRWVPAVAQVAHYSFLVPSTLMLLKMNVAVTHMGILIFSSCFVTGKGVFSRQR